LYREHEVITAMEQGDISNGSKQLMMKKEMIIKVIKVKNLRRKW
jgi:hypothetical protein